MDNGAGQGLASEDNQPQTRGGGERSIEGALWDEATGAWVLPQADPYTIENIQLAYNNLAAGKSRQKLTGSGVAREFLTRRQLTPTHLSIKIFPRTEDEQWAVEKMEDVRVAYLPFDYVQLTEDEAQTLDARYGTASGGSGQSGQSGSTSGTGGQSGATSGGQSGPASGIRAGAASLPDERRHTVTYTDMQTTEGPTPDVTLTMPVLYVVWPIEKPLPAELDYEVVGELFQPASTMVANDAKASSSSYDTSNSGASGSDSGQDVLSDNSSSGSISSSTSGSGSGGSTYGTSSASGGSASGFISTTGLSAEATQILENEAIIQALGSGAIIDDPVSVINPWWKTGRIVKTDNLATGNRAPIANLGIRFQLGSWVSKNYYTDSDGRFSFYTGPPMLQIIGGPVPPESISTNANMQIVFQHDNWKITYENTTLPMVSTYATVSFFWNSRTDMTINMSTSYASLEAHRAVNFYYFGDHEVPKRTVNGNRGIRIEISSEKQSAEGWSGKFTSTPFGDEYITIYNYSPNNNVMTIGATLHELGHMAQYSMRSTAVGYSLIDKILKESWASYVGWYLGETYYTSIGWNKPSVDSDITGQARQGWIKDNSDAYSPLYIDLIDDYNQKTNAPNSNRPNDRISITDSYVHSVIAMIAREHNDLDSGLRNALRDNLDCDGFDLNLYLHSYE